VSSGRARLARELPADGYVHTLTIVLGVILIVRGVTGFLGTSLRFRERGAWITAVGLVVDVRMPVYVWTEGAALLDVGPLIAIMSGGVIAGTLPGRPILGRSRTTWS